ncbi:MAG: YigZ family protein [Candidatus Aminicenantes bacterium]|nr:MAG: YigZ family protein [Candidatus Aminicenantes bacterium]
MVKENQLQRFFTIAKTYGPEEIKEKGSRFIAYLYPAATAKEAESIIAGLRKKYHDATHVCFAYRLGKGKEEYSRSSDDGEPGGTAGLPIYYEIKNKDYLNVLAVVIRYFGGTKLGSGGLARAYAAAARKVIETAKTLTIDIKKEVSLDFSYDFLGEIMNLVHRFSLEIVKQEYTARGISMKLAVPIAQMEEVTNVLARISSGKLQWQ